MKKYNLSKIYDNSFKKDILDIIKQGMPEGSIYSSEAKPPEGAQVYTTDRGAEYWIPSKKDNVGQSVDKDDLDFQSMENTPEGYNFVSRDEFKQFGAPEVLRADGNHDLVDDEEFPRRLREGVEVDYMVPLDVADHTGIVRWSEEHDEPVIHAIGKSKKWFKENGFENIVPLSEVSSISNIKSITNKKVLDKYGKVYFEEENSLRDAITEGAKHLQDPEYPSPIENYNLLPLKNALREIHDDEATINEFINTKDVRNDIMLAINDASK